METIKKKKKEKKRNDIPQEFSLPLFLDSSILLDAQFEAISKQRRLLSKSLAACWHDLERWNDVLELPEWSKWPISSFR